MEYWIREAGVIQQYGNLWEYVKKMDACNQRNIVNVQKLILLVKEAGLEETEKYLKQSLNQMERANMCVRAAVSTLSSVE